jgi:hypothetical protein
LDSLWSFPEDAREYAASKILNPLIEKVNDAIKLSEDIRSNDDIELLKQKNKLDQVENIIWEIKEVLGEDDTRFQTVANAFADEVCACAVKALNDFKKPKLSMELIRWADSLPSFSRIKVRIADNLENISSWLEDDEEDEIFGEIVKKIKLNVFTLTQAATLLEDMKRLLAEIKLKVGGSDLFFNPQNHIVTISMGIIAKVMVETQMRNTTSLQQFNDFFWPTTSMPTVRGWSFIIKVDLQFRFPSISLIHQQTSK